MPLPSGLKEGQIFRGDSDALTLYKVENGKVVEFTPYLTIPESERGQIGNVGAVTKEVYRRMGINPGNYPIYNVPDVLSALKQTGFVRGSAADFSLPASAPTAGAAPVTPTPSSGGSSNIAAPVTGKKFQETDVYKNLSADEREMADLLFNVIKVGGESEADTFAKAIQQAISVADPWAKAQAALVLAEFAGSVDETIFSFEAKTEAIKRARDIIAEDVSGEKEFLSLEQQAELAKQVRQYDEDLLTIADQAAEKGLTFATGARSRQLAEERKGQQFEEVVQSNRRKFNFQMKELELKAARGDTEAAKQLETLTAEKGFALQKIGRSAEEVLGSAGVPTIPGYTPVGGITGKITEEKEKKIISDVGGVIGLSNILTEGA